MSMASISIGSFQILGTLGTGAHSSILHIRRSADSAQYALKVVDIKAKDELKYLEQARHEFRVAQMLNHPDLIKIYSLELKRDWLLRPRKVHLLIEFVNGKTLDAIPRLSLSRLVQIFAKIAAGLMHMHRRGVYHADIKPNNILLSRTGDVKVIDYGLAWVRGEDKGRLQGTPEYMAPEQSRRGVVNEQTDIYNFGATMYRLVTFRLPPITVHHSSSKSLDAQTWEANLRPVADCNPQAPKALCDLIHHCLSYEARNRIERVSDVQEILEKLVGKMVKKPEDSLEAMEW
jgi:eukaryotic-like serine/threonine-protein kinase